MAYDEDSYNPLYDPDDPRGVASPPDPDGLRETDQFPLDSREYPDASEADENTCSRCGTTTPPDRTTCESFRSETIPVGPCSTTQDSTARSENEPVWTFDHVIHAIIDACTHYEAVAKAAVAFRQRTGLSFPKEVLNETFDLVYDFDEEPAPMLTRRWGELPVAAPLTSDASDTLFTTAYELTDWIEDDSDGSATYLYDEVGTPIRSRGQLIPLLTDLDPTDGSTAELWIVPALGYKPTTRKPPERPVFRGPARELRECWSCREETEHQFVEIEDLPEEVVPDAIWECRRCGAPIYGPIP